MAVTVVSSQFANGDTLTMPSHQAGDLLIAIAHRNANTTIPTEPAGWFTHFTAGANNQGARIASKYATSSSESFGAWTNAEQVLVVVCRSDDGKGVYLNATNSAGANSTSISYPALAFSTVANNSTMFFGFVGVKVNDSNADTAPSGMTNIGSLAGVSAGEIALHNSTPATSWSAATFTASTSVEYRSIIFGVTETQFDLASGGGGIAKLLGNGLIG
jgi:hypothetical protein